MAVARPKHRPGNAVFRALSDPTRREVLALLRQQDMTAGDIGAHFDVTPATMSGHFTVLKEAGLVQADRVGNSVRYHLNLSVLEETLMTLLDTLGIIAPSEVAATPTPIPDRDDRGPDPRTTNPDDHHEPSPPEPVTAGPLEA